MYELNIERKRIIAKKKIKVEKKPKIKRVKET